MNNDDINSAIAQLKSFSKKYRETPKQPPDMSVFVPESATIKTLHEFMSLTSDALTELSRQVQANEEAAKKRHDEIVNASNASARFAWPNLICAIIAALGVLVPACVWLISHLCSNV